MGSKVRSKTSFWKVTLSVFHMMLTTTIFELQKKKNNDRFEIVIEISTIVQRRIFDFESSLLAIFKSVPKNWVLADIPVFQLSPKGKMVLPALNTESKIQDIGSVCRILWF